MYYAPTVLEDSGLTRSASLLASVTVGIAMIVFTVVGMWILGLMGRRTMMLLGTPSLADIGRQQVSLAPALESAPG